MVGATRSEDVETTDFCRKALACTRIVVCATVEPSRRVDVQNKADNRYMMQLRECLRREGKGLVKSGRGYFRDAECGNRQERQILDITLGDISRLIVVL